MANPKIKTVIDDIKKSEGDKRDYRGIELTNGMKILLISDPTTDKSSAAIDVNIGHMSDPDDLPGLAHFCEHMLFLGTEKFPEENEYSKFLSEHGGSSNAYTSGEHTNYYFDVAPDSLLGALDRFAQFFLCPLFTESATEREVNAVNSENDNYITNDGWRIYQLDKALAKPDHPFSKFGIGNKDTLLTIPKERGQDTRQELLIFHNKYYSSNLMSLAILGKETLDELSEMVIPLFENVKNKNVPIPEWTEHPYGPKEVKIQAKVVPVKDLRSLNVTWPIPDLHPYWKSNPGRYLGHLIGHEGTGSLLSELKKKGWVNTLAGGQEYGAKGFMFFNVDVDLSEEGIEHVDDIVTLIFQYINLLKDEGPQEWIFQECKDLDSMLFRFKDKEKPSNYTCVCAGSLHDYPMKDVLSSGLLLEDNNPDIIVDVLNKLTPDTVRVTVIGQKFKDEVDTKEKWYGTEYKVEKIPEEKLEVWRNAGLHPKFTLPNRNEFIPTDFTIVPPEKEPQKLPQVIKNSNMTRLWYKKDDKFLLPKACINIEIISAQAYVDPQAESLTYMFTILFEDALNEYAYDAELAGLYYYLLSTKYGLSLSLNGYNHKQYILLEKIIHKMTTFEINPQRFAIMKENYIRDLRNFKAEEPNQQTDYYTTILISEQIWTKEELLEAAEEMTVELLQEFIPKLLSKIYLEFLIYGNVTKENALQIVEMVEQTLQKNAASRFLSQSQRKNFRQVILPDANSFVYKETNDVHKSSCVDVYYQCDIQNTANNIHLEMLDQIIVEPCFDILRTQEQLGYIVYSGVKRNDGVQGLRVIVQSDRDPEYVESRIEAFLHKMGKHIEDMTQEVFENHVKALRTIILEKPKKLTSQNDNFMAEIISQQYNFDRDNIESEFLKTVTKADVLQFYKTFIGADSPKRHKLCVHVLSTAPETEASPSQSEETTTVTPKTIESEEDKDGILQQYEVVEVTDIIAFKRGLGLFPLPKPYIDISPVTSESCFVTS